MKDYKEFTFGWPLFIILAPIHLLITYWYLNNVGDKPMSGNDYLVVSITVAVIYFLFYGLTTQITAGTIIVSFGVGLIRKKIKLTTVQAVSTVKSPWYYGWGIRIIPRGTLYNISGTDGVELKMNDTDRVVRIGTQNPVTLKKEIEKRLVLSPGRC